MRTNLMVFAKSLKLRPPKQNTTKLRKKEIEKRKNALIFYFVFSPPPFLFILFIY